MKLTGIFEFISALNCRCKLLVFLTLLLCQPGSADEQLSKSRNGYATLWAQTCSRCHNMRSPSEYSDIKWDISAQHMRSRAYLTAEEYRIIKKFLKSAN